MTNNNLVCSIHIPKCAGTTLAGIFQSVYGDRFLHVKGAIVTDLWNDYNLSKVDCVHGHFAVSPPEIDRPVQYITFLRNPIERLLSYYWFIQGDKSNSQYAWTSRLTLREWVETQKLACLDNDMVRFLAGREHYNFNYPGKFVDKDDLEMAKENLKKFAFVGVIEDFGSDLAKLADRLRWGRVPKYSNERVSADRPTRNEISQSTLDYLKETQKYDMALYWMVFNGDL